MTNVGQSLQPRRGTSIVSRAEGRLAQSMLSDKAASCARPSSMWSAFDTDPCLLPAIPGCSGYFADLAFSPYSANGENNFVPSRKFSSRRTWTIHGDPRKDAAQALDVVAGIADLLEGALNACDVVGARSGTVQTASIQAFAP